jgi:hypothetical protein
VITPSCTGTTKSGKPCRSFALPGRTLCVAHDPQYAAAAEAARRKGGTTAMKLKVLQGRRQRLDTPRALTRFLGDVMLDLLAGKVEVDVARTLAYCASVQKGLIEVAELEARLAALETAAGQQRRIR